MSRAMFSFFALRGQKDRIYTSSDRMTLDGERLILDVYHGDFTLSVHGRLFEPRTRLARQLAPQNQLESYCAFSLFGSNESSRADH